MENDNEDTETRKLVGKLNSDGTLFLRFKSGHELSDVATVVLNPRFSNKDVVFIQMGQQLLIRCPVRQSTKVILSPINSKGNKMKRRYYISLPTGTKKLYSQTRNQSDVDFIEQELDEAGLEYTWEQI